MTQIIPATIHDTKTGEVWRFPRALQGREVSESEADALYARYCPRFSRAGITAAAEEHRNGHESMRPKGARRRFNRRDR